jgi:NADPH-dependent 2,4-dienoyl-CoA reductase/sulfur reductase-like enzyme/nitrite reductase/ring-hydroxylating ferredoxin subunit
MGGTDTKLTGPDLAQGVPTSHVPDGGTLLGHAAGEAVLLARRGEHVWAVSATCTHYGGPLAEGRVIGEEVRCPWHHACFNLRTGEAVRAPALNPIACYDVESRGGKFIVLGKREPLTTKRGPSGAPTSVVIVGAGAAGNACAEALRREGYAGDITMIGAEATTPVDRPNLSKDYLAGNAPEEWMPLRGEDFYEAQKIELLRGTRVVKIDVKARAVELEGGKTVPYGALVLATGADPLKPPVAGVDGEGVFFLRTLADSRAIIERAKQAKRAVVIGGSFIGLEVAASLRTRGVEVDLVAPEKLPLARVMGDEIGAFVKKLHDEHGVRFHLGTIAKSIEGGAVVLESGERLEGDLVVVGTGVRTNVALAEAAGLGVDRGIVVDDRLRTSAPAVWAIGDAARWPDPRTGEKIRVEHWVVAERMGQIAARNILGANVKCDIVPFFWSAHYDVTINYVGHAEKWDALHVAGNLDARDAAIAFRRAGRTLAVATIGRDGAALDAEAAMERGDEEALGRLVPAP